MSKKENMINTTYADAMRELSEIVAALQANEVPISELSARVARAAELIQFCKQQLRNTEEDIEKLLAE
jgi:exodeoxyribonuclease VII small subunit